MYRQLLRRSKFILTKYDSGGIISLFSKVIKKSQRTTEYTSNRVINPSKASCSRQTSHKPRQLDVSSEILCAHASVLYISLQNDTSLCRVQQLKCLYLQPTQKVNYITNINTSGHTQGLCKDRDGVENLSQYQISNIKYIIYQSGNQRHQSIMSHLDTND